MPINNHVETPFPHISYNEKNLALTNKHSVTVNQDSEFHHLEFKEENNGIEETDYHVECETYDHDDSLSKMEYIDYINAPFSSTPSTSDVKVASKTNQTPKNTVKTTPSLPLSPWNQSITLEDKVQRFLAQAAELAHHNGKIKSEYGIKEPTPFEENHVS